MKLIHDSTLCLLHLLLLAELFVRCSASPAHRPPLCPSIPPMIHQVDGLTNSCRKLHDLTGDELMNFVALDNRLDGLPNIEQTFSHFSSSQCPQVNKSLSQMLLYTNAFRLHVDWLATAKENFSLSSQPAEGAITHLLQLSNLLNASLHQMGEEASQSPPPSLPVASSAFDVLWFSVEISQRLHVFCDWSKRVLRLQKRPCC